ncbi:hypothetical protein VNI00_005033 [Paramarasmius palmivorus]|uniref:Uncharacterized protein n=1 Tax=Paramarasmius palmivorus TaxID=297713 RepID=A0AAW0DEI0_9AGAR
MSAGAEAENSTTASLAEDEEWLKVELFKLRLRPRTMKLEQNGLRFPPLPPGKTAVTVFGDFLGYLFKCTRSFISDTHANGSSLWRQVEPTLQFVLSHPNGWEGAQQAKIRRAAVHGGLIPDTPEGKARIWFVSEGEASFEACVLSGLANDVLSDRSKSGFLVVDAGGGTCDISAYTIRSQHPLVIEEIAPPDCIFAGSVFVSRRARVLFEEKLKNSKYGTPDALDHITKRFDETTKRLFRNKNDPQFIVFGSPLDKDLSSVFLVGGYAASAWLFSQLQERLAPYKVSVSRPDSQTSKAVADGAIGFFCDHHVSARVSKFMYGVEYLREYNPEDVEHVMRKDRLTELPSGPRLLPDAFDCILARGVKVKESTVFTRKYCTELTSLNLLSANGTFAEEFSTLCLVRADLSPLSGSAEPKKGKHGRTYWNIVFSVEIHFGLTEFKSRIKWVDNFSGPASIIYNERGHRSDEDEPDGIPEDDTMAQSTKGSTRAPSRAQSRDSFHTPGVTAPSSKRASVVGPPSQPAAAAAPAPAPPPPPVDPIPPIDTSFSSRASTARSPNMTPTRELANAVNDSLRGRSKSKSKSRASSTAEEITSPSTRSSSKLGEALSSVWDASGGVVASPTSKSARSVAGSIKSKKSTPAASPKVVETPVAPVAEEMPLAPPPPIESTSAPTDPPVLTTSAESSIPPAPAPAVEESLERSIEAADVIQPTPATAATPSTIAVDVPPEEAVITSTSPITDTQPPITDAPAGVTETKPPSTVISPISLPDDVAVDPQTQPISAASPSGEGLGILSNAMGALTNGSLSDLLSSPDPTAGAGSLLSGQLGGIASGLGSRFSSGFGWGGTRSPGGTSSPKPPGSPKPETSAVTTPSTPKPASTPRASRPPTVPPTPKISTPRAGTPRAATPLQASTPVPASTPKPSSPSLPEEGPPKEETQVQESDMAHQEHQEATIEEQKEAETAEQITGEATSSQPEGSTPKAASVVNSPKTQPTSVEVTETSAEAPAPQTSDATSEAIATEEQVATTDTPTAIEANGSTETEVKKEEPEQNGNADASTDLAAELAKELEGDKGEEVKEEEEEEEPANNAKGGAGGGAKKKGGGGGGKKKGKGKKK